MKQISKLKCQRLFFFYILNYNKSMQFSKTKILLLLLLLTSLRSVISYPFLQQYNIPISLSADQFLYDNAIDVVDNYTVSIYYITTFTNTSILKIYQQNISETVRTSISCSLIDSYTFGSFTFNVLKQTISVFYTNSIGKMYRVLIKKQNLVISSNSSQYVRYNGVYSKLWDVFYWNDQYDNQGLYKNIDNASPSFLYSGSFQTGYLIKYILSPQQNYVITLYQNFNSFSFRKLLNSSQIVNQYSSPVSLSIDNGGYQHAFFKTDGKTLILFQNCGFLDIFDLTTQNKFQTMVSLYGIISGYYQSSTGSIYFLSQDAVSLQTIVGYVDSSYLVYQNVAYFQQRYPKVSTDGNFLLMMNNSLLTLNIINRVLFCQIPGTYRDVNFALCQNCSANCLKCLSYQTCSVCATNYFINSSGMCISNVTNNSAATNSTNSSVIPIIQINNTIETNKTYATYVIENLLGNSPISSLNKVPASRRLFNFVFYYISNFDDFWLYQYHQRDYGSNMNSLISQVRNLEQLKWTIVDSQQLTNMYNKLDYDENQLVSHIDGKIKYSGSKFQQLQQKGEGFFTNCWDFFTINLTMVLLMFFSFRVAFRFLFNFKISKFLRPFSFWGYLGLIMIDGNLQYFFFLFLSQHKIGFSLSLLQKGLNFLNYFFFFVCIWFTFSCYFLFFFFYKKLAKYFYDNNECNLDGIFGLIVSSSLKNLLLAGIHNFLRQNYRTQIPSLMAIEVMFLVFVLHQHKNSKSYIESHKLWITILFSWLKIILQMTLYLQQQFKSDDQLANLFDEIIGIIIIVYLFLYYVGIAIILIKKLSIISKNKHSQSKSKQLFLSNHMASLSFNMNESQLQQNSHSKQEVLPIVISTDLDSIYRISIDNFYEKQGQKYKEIQKIDRFTIVKKNLISKNTSNTIKIKEIKQSSKANILKMQILLNKGKSLTSKKSDIFQRIEKISVQ